MGTLLIAIALVLLGLLALYWTANSAITICTLVVHEGQLSVRKGSLSPSVLSDLGDIVRRSKVSRGSIRILRAKDRARCELGGDFSAAQKQQIRNVIGNTPLPRLRGPKK